MSQKRPQNLLALAVLAVLYERPMHPYEMASTLKERREEESIKLRYGSLYTVIDSLQSQGLIEARETQREGKRPERTVFGLTAAGEEFLKDWMSDLLGEPAKEYPSFKSALSLMPVLPPDEAVTLLDRRVGRLDGRIAEATESLSVAKREAGLPELLMVEALFEIEALRTERDFAANLAKRIRAAEIEGVGFWREVHKAAPEKRHQMVEEFLASIARCCGPEGKFQPDGMDSRGEAAIIARG